MTPVNIRSERRAFVKGWRLASSLHSPQFFSLHTSPKTQIPSSETEHPHLRTVLMDARMTSERYSEKGRPTPQIDNRGAKSDL